MIQYIETYLNEFTYLLMEMAPWLLFGFIFAGILHVYMPKGSIKRTMGGRNIKSVIYAAILGIPLPLCSCGVIPTGISFFKEGASKSATVSFLISTPQTGVDSILATYSLMGLPFAILRPVVAFFSGIFGGAVTNFYTRHENENPPKKTRDLPNEVNTNGRFRTMINYAFYEFLMEIAKWLIIGLALAALISMLLPDDFFTLYLKNELLSMLIVLAASIPIYVCATGSIPIAAVLMMKGLSPGAALVFLMAGPATNTATMAVIGKAIDKKTLIVYLATITFSAILFGMLTNTLLPEAWFTGFISEHGAHEHELLPGWLKISSGIILILLILNGYIRKYFITKKQSETSEMEQKINFKKYRVEGMTCNHCKANVEKGIMQLEGIDEVTANPDTNEVLIKGDPIDDNRIKRSVEEIGYEFKGSIE